MGSFVAQELAIRYPERVNKIILYAGDCGGKEAVMPSPQVLKDLANNSGSPEESGMRLFNLLFPKEWLSKQPAFYKWFPLPKETSLPDNMQRQAQAIATWPGACDRLSSIKSPALVVTGTNDSILTGLLKLSRTLSSCPISTGLEKSFDRSFFELVKFFLLSNT
jgi:pimeloyl-ACP methyl ester carboxylesterase